MIIRDGFVSNSSSSSFIIKKKHLSPHQIKKIKKHWRDRDQDSYPYENDGSSYDAWDITENKKSIEGFTTMDNFDMANYLEKMGVKSKFINWSD